MSDTPKTLREYVTTTAINTVPPLVAYYVLRMFDVEPYLALVGAIITAAAQGALTMVRKRKVEPANVVVIIGAACSLTIALTTKNPRIVQALELVPMSLLVWSFAISGLLRKPNSKKVAGVVSPALAEPALPDRGWTEQSIQDWHRLHTQLCVGLGLLCGVYPVFALYMIVNYQVDLSQFVIVATGPTLVVLCIVYAVARIRRFVGQHDDLASASVCGDRESRL